ncbi:hypothetical protein [Yersinia phage vB_Yru_GN1]|uniref:Uncharacterized protein n=1 Tax=Yersinia phage vB_Yru_GN1 TaxID=3074381 RepID=A0AA86MGX1_9CAUD|nr:hypothetical protein [Yersinia phage vB_Yru_GN1]
MNLWKGRSFHLYHFFLSYRENKWILEIGDVGYQEEKVFPVKPTKKQIRQFKNQFYRRGYNTRTELIKDKNNPIKDRPNH